MYPADYSQKLGQMYYLEEHWFDMIDDSCMTKRMRKQQQAIWEFLTTERKYIQKLRVICEVNFSNYLDEVKLSDLRLIDSVAKIC